MRLAVPEDIAGIARIHIESWRTTYAGLMAADFLANLRMEERERLWRANFKKPAGPILVETEGSEVVGFAYGGPNRGKETAFQAELYALYVVDRLHRQGVGRRLLLGFMESLAAPSMITWALEGNPACGFYEAMGGERLGSKKIMIGGAFLTEISYGWTTGSRVGGA